MKKIIKKLPVIGSIAKVAYFRLVAPFKSFPGSEAYWKQRYRSGGTSGAGSYREIAAFKAQVVNGFVKENHIRTLIEFGCGDGNQLGLSEYPSYLGFDVSPEAISQCRTLFANDDSKAFKLVDEYADEKAELTMSLDVIYHLVEDAVYEAYMARLFDASTQFVIIFSSNTDEQSPFQAPHVKHRQFSNWVEEQRPAWRLVKRVPNRYPDSEEYEDGPVADVYIFEQTR